jgi:hypothetical protein
VSFYSPNLVIRWSPEAGIEPLACDPQGVFLAAPTNLEFIGKELDTIVLANLARWQLSRVKLGVKGASPHYPSAALIGN